MLQNKIYQNFIKEIIKTFFVILFGFSVIAWTVRAVNFLDLIVDNGYSITTYFQYSFLNLFGIMTKFVPLSFLLALLVFIVKQLQENEFVILWTSGVKKLNLVNFFFNVSILVVLFYYIFSIFLTPFLLNKSRLLLGKENFNSLLPTMKVQQFSDSFKGFTFIIGKRVNNEIKNIFIHDESNTLKNLSTDNINTRSITIVAEEGLVEQKRMLLFKGQIISNKKDNIKTDIVKFEQLNIDLKNLKTTTITYPKLQETPSHILIQCVLEQFEEENKFCKKNAREEIITILNRRFVLPFYIPVISLLCSFLLIKPKTKKNYFLNKYSIFLLSFLVLLYAELIVRYTGLSNFFSLLFIFSPLIFLGLIYFLLIYNFAKEPRSLS